MKNNISFIAITIGSMAEILNVHQSTLRIYDKKGLLKPKRTPKNRRMYGLGDIEKGKLILYLTRNLALNLSGVNMIIGLLEEFKINSSEYFNLIQKIAQNKNINEEINIQNTSKRGRKKNI